MLTADRMHGVCAMMPAFTTPDGGQVDNRSTVNVDELMRAVDQIVRDGVDVVATTGTFGELYNLLWEEFQDLTRATVKAVDHRVPCIIGCTSPNPREVIRKMELIQESGADGVILGAPYYMPLTPENAVQFYLDVADRFPSLGIMIYHNPEFHHVTIPVSGFREFATRPNILAMKDSHRQVDAFMNIVDIVKGGVSLFVRQAQLPAYAPLGAAGCWAIDAWMGPWPLLLLRDACKAGDYETAKRVTLEMGRVPSTQDLKWRDLVAKLAMNDAGYCTAGPLRAPFRRIPDAMIEVARARGRAWRELAERCRAEMTAGALAAR